MPRRTAVISCRYHYAFLHAVDSYDHFKMALAMTMDCIRGIHTPRCKRQILSQFNSLAPGRYVSNFKSVNTVHMLRTKFMSTSCKIVLKWIPKNIFNEVMPWCCQATSHYLTQCWPKYMSGYGETRPQWVNLSIWNNIKSLIKLSN